MLRHRIGLFTLGLTTLSLLLVSKRCIFPAQSLEMAQKCFSHCVHRFGFSPQVQNSCLFLFSIVFSFPASEGVAIIFEEEALKFFYPACIRRLTPGPPPLQQHKRSLPRALRRKVERKEGRKERRNEVDVDKSMHILHTPKVTQTHSAMVMMRALTDSKALN